MPAFFMAAITCTTTPAHVANSVKVRVRNPDTRVGYLPVDYTYVGGSSRTTDSLRVAKSGANAMLTWTCGGCSASAPARINRAQDAQFNVYLENYNGGTGGSYNNSGAVGTAQSYFWTVE